MSDNAAKDHGLTFEFVQKRYFPTDIFRENTQCVPMRVNFVFLNGGGGDLIAWTPAIRWLAERATWIDGTWIVPVYFRELAEYWLKPYMPRWNILTYEELKGVPKVDDAPVRGPIHLQTESLNATGAHLLTCGWVYFTNKEKAPDGNSADGRPWDSYPYLDQAHLDTVKLPNEVMGLAAKRYVVVTTGITTPSRNVPPQYWNYIIEYVRSLGLTPVFLGKESVITGNASNIHTQFSRELRLNLGVNLINQTSLMQAASIMSRAAVVIGHDNGLLHLAGCTDVPIVFGYNLASPEHRMPRRPSGNVFNVTLTNKELACNHCQSTSNFVIGFNYRECRYSDLKCIHMLFENKAERWKVKIDEALNCGAGK